MITLICFYSLYETYKNKITDFSLFLNFFPVEEASYKEIINKLEFIDDILIAFNNHIYVGMKIVISELRVLEKITAEFKMIIPIYSLFFKSSYNLRKICNANVLHNEYYLHSMLNLNGLTTFIKVAK